MSMQQIRYIPKGNQPLAAALVHIWGKHTERIERDESESESECE